jgi:tetratricopeptide (TPR) repeat protein
MGWTRFAANAVLVSIMLMSSRGLFDRADAYLKRAVAARPDDPRLLLLRAWREYETGGQREAKRLLDRYLATEKSTRSWPTSLYAMALLATIYKMTGYSAVCETVRRIDQQIGLTGPAAIYMDGAATGLALIAAVDGDRRIAASYYRRLRKVPRVMRGGLVISADRLRALLARAEGRSIRAIHHFRRAIRFCRKGFRTELSWTLYDYAETLSRLGKARHARKTDLLLDQADRTAADLGMTCLRKKIGAMRTSESDES